MKEKLKQTKGITLIALIITIIVLLILAVVSIRLIINQGIIGKAEQATNDYSTAEEKEQIQLGYSEYQMAKAQGESNPTLKVEGATVTGDEANGWSVTFTKNDGTTKTYKVNASGTTIDFETIKSDVLANKQVYLAKAAEAGQNTTSNKDIGIGTDGNIVNLDLWQYKVKDGSVCIYGIGSHGGAYKGREESPIVPQYILIDGNNDFLILTSFGDSSDQYSEPFAEEATIKNIIVPNTVTTLVDCCFYNAKSIETIAIPNSVTSIGVAAFSGCSDLTSITISNGVTSIGGNAFWGCSSLTSITIPNSVTSIGSSAFINCSSLTSIKIDNTEGTISGAPWGAASTTKITYLR